MGMPGMMPGMPGMMPGMPGAGMPGAAAPQGMYPGGMPMQPQQMGMMNPMLLMQMHTPIDSGHTLLRHQYYIPSELEGSKVNVTKALVRETSRQIEQDISIWKHKKYLPEPTLVNGDGPILAYREFFKRYYA